MSLNNNNLVKPSANDCLENQIVFNTWREEKTFTDFTLVSSDGVEFPVHKCMISAWSLYFRTLLTHWIKGESSDSKTKLENVDSEVSTKFV